MTHRERKSVGPIVGTVIAVMFTAISYDNGKFHLSAIVFGVCFGVIIGYIFWKLADT